jgi:DNA repair exonuclease SbcCD nuclease subunit
LVASNSGGGAILPPFLAPANGTAMRGVFIGDLHKDRLKKLFGEKSNALQIEEIRKPLEYALEKGIRTVIFGGDVCEREVMSYDAHLRLIELIVEYGHKRKLDIHIILGNHDFAEDGTHSLLILELMAKLGLLKCHIYTKPKQVALEEIPFTFLPFPHKKMASKVATVNIGHFEVKGSMRDNGSRSKSDHVIKRDQNLWLLGHLHTSQQPFPNVYFSGTLYQLNFGESLPKGWVDFSVKHTKSGKLVHGVDLIRNDPAFKLFSLNIETARDLRKIKPNPLYQYSLFVHEGVELPENVRIEYPNIAQLSGYKTKRELEALQQNTMLPIDQQTLKEVSIFYGLKENLRKQGATSDQVARAMKLVRKFEKVKL